VGDPGPPPGVASATRPDIGGARLGGNITGSSNFSAGLSAKRLELIKESFPGVQRVAVLLNPENSVNERSLQAMERAAKSLKVGLGRYEVRDADAFRGAFSAMALDRVQAVVLPEDDFLNANRRW
jgi:putative tryptophan/tyrosine transport system substrate-binding protein